MFSITVVCGPLADNDSYFDIRLEVMLGFSWSSRVDLRPGSERFRPDRKTRPETYPFTRGAQIYLTDQNRSDQNPTRATHFWVRLFR